jgi:hypothetical protein
MMLLPVLAAAAIEATRLKVDLTWGGEEVLHFSDRQTEIDETHRFKLAFRVTDQGDFWTIERRSDLIGSKVGDVDLPPPPKPQTLIEKEWLSTKGLLIEAEPFDKGKFLLDRLIHWWLPSTLPDQWTADLNSSTAHIRTRGLAEFKLKRDAGQSRLYDFTLTSEDADDISAKGTMWFDEISGRLLIARIKAKHAWLPGGTERADVSLTYTDSKTKPQE